MTFCFLGLFQVLLKNFQFGCLEDKTNLEFAISKKPSLAFDKDCLSVIVSYFEPRDVIRMCSTNKATRIAIHEMFQNYDQILLEIITQTMVSLIENKFLGASKSLFNVRSLLESNGLTSPVHNGKHPLSTYVRNDEQVRVQLRPLLCLMKFAYGACLIRPNSLELEPVIRRHDHTVITFLLNHEGLRRFSNVLEWSVDNDDEKEPLIVCDLIKIQYSGNNEFQMFLIDENIKIYGVDEWKMVIERLYYLKERK